MHASRPVTDTLRWHASLLPGIPAAAVKLSEFNACTGIVCCLFWQHKSNSKHKRDRYNCCKNSRLVDSRIVQGETCTRVKVALIDSDVCKVQSH